MGHVTKSTRFFVGMDGRSGQSAVWIGMALADTPTNSKLKHRLLALLPAIQTVICSANYNSAL
jgi:hypothetical protein